ncbi:protein RUFY3-like isoform X1 [Paramormyrops kingsleyae]|uniref:RUN and FYVE domain containing 3 n=1 Tax=Paramormyrops kingsleyae TaxID=1676925 RepID=A0A3B3Q5E2_9TELE|nr:protein RUFY3-like isoform X1 [Paramormyrops kingsleyae]
MAEEGITSAGRDRDLHLPGVSDGPAAGGTDRRSANSPEEPLSPTSVIFFKEALGSSSVQLPKSTALHPGLPQCEPNTQKPARKKPKDPFAIERLNLMNMAKLSIKGLIESALNFGRTLDSDYAPLQQFFVVMEHCLKHGLKAKKTFLGQNKSLWGPLELVEKLNPEAAEITASVKELPGLKTPLGRGRAWLRLALMQKKLSDYMKTIINRKDLLSEFYEANALMMEEEGAVIAGLLVGLNVIDANLCMKGEDLDSQVGVIDFSMYLKDDGQSSRSPDGEEQITAILDQKNYVEELNRHLSASVNNLQIKVDTLEKSNTKLTKELAVANNRVLTLQEEISHMQEGNALLTECGHKGPGAEVAADDQVSGEVWKKLKEETQLRLDVESELEVQIGMKQEMELAMKMLEKDICEKQDALAALRKQLDDMRMLNQQLSLKTQSSDVALKQKSDIISHLEEKTTQMASMIKQLELRTRQAERQRSLAEEANRFFKQEFGDKIESLQLEVDELQRKRSSLEMELKKEKQRRSGPNPEASDAAPAQKKPSSPPTDVKQQMEEIRKELEAVRKENVQLRTVLDEKESLSPSMSLSQTEDDQGESLTECSQPSLCNMCGEESSLTRPKKHCNHCQVVFCENCLVHELPLPSSIKPVQVCDQCHSQLLLQYSSSPS